MRHLFYLFHRLFRRNCKQCRHRYSQNECDINIGLWADYGYCSMFEMKK